MKGKLWKTSKGEYSNHLFVEHKIGDILFYVLRSEKDEVHKGLYVNIVDKVMLYVTNELNFSRVSQTGNIKTNQDIVDQLKNVIMSEDYKPTSYWNLYPLDLFKFFNVEHKYYEALENINIIKLEKEQKEQERKEELLEREKQAILKHKAYIESLIEKIKNNEKVDGEDLYQVANYIDYKIHPRSVNALRERVVNVNSDQALMSGNSKPWLVYRVIRNLLNEE